MSNFVIRASIIKVTIYISYFLFKKQLETILFQILELTIPSFDDDMMRSYERLFVLFSPLLGDEFSMRAYQQQRDMAYLG